LRIFIALSAILRLSKAVKKMIGPLANKGMLSLSID